MRFFSETFLFVSLSQNHFVSFSVFFQKLVLSQQRRVVYQIAIAKCCRPKSLPVFPRTLRFVQQTNATSRLAVCVPTRPRTPTGTARALWSDQINCRVNLKRPYRLPCLRQFRLLATLPCQSIDAYYSIKLDHLAKTQTNHCACCCALNRTGDHCRPNSVTRRRCISVK